MIVRRAVPDDADAVSNIYGPIVTDTAISFEEEPPTIDEVEERISSSVVWVVAEEGDEVLGYGYAGRFHERAAYRWSVEVSIYVAPTAQRRGVGKALLTRLVDDLRARGYVNAFAGIALPNDGSVALFEAFGFENIAVQRRVGFKLSRWHDVGWWQLQLREPTTPPPSLVLPPD